MQFNELIVYVLYTLAAGAATEVFVEVGSTAWAKPAEHNESDFNVGRAWIACWISSNKLFVQLGTQGHMARFAKIHE